ncbi:MAG: hypothetical protein ACFB6S_19180 [Geminicoccaceae bacterium]
MSALNTVFWLKIAAGVVIGFGILAALAAHPGTAAPFRLLADLVLWPIDGAQSLATDESRILCAIAGGLMCGWGVLLWLVADRLPAQAPGLVKPLILASVVSWFVVDSLASVAAGAPLNAVLNAGFLAMFVVPLIRRPRLDVKAS